MKKLFQKILLVINYLSAGLLLFSYLAAHLSPEHFWPLAFIGLAYPALVLINVFFFIYWLFHLKRYLFISLIALLAGLNHLQDVIPHPFRKDTDLDVQADKTLKVLSFNVRAFNIYDWLTDPNTDKGIFNFIRSEHPDIICLQEFYTNNRNNLSSARLKYLFGETPYKHIEYSIRNANNTGFGIATFSRYPIVRQGSIPFQNSVNLSIYTDILYNGDTVRIFNNHLQSIRLKENNYAFLDSLKLRYNDEQIRELHDLSSKLKSAYMKRAQQSDLVAKAIKETPYPILVCGDFNDTPVSYTYHNIKGNMKDAWSMSGRGWGNTYPGKFPFRIDYIFYDDYFESIDFERIKTRLSDHYPIFAVLKVTSE